MRYRMLRPGGKPPAGSPITLYVMALSGDPSDYRILWPRVRDERLTHMLAGGRIEIRSFRDPDAAAETDVRAIVRRTVGSTLARARKRSVTMLGVGSLLIVAGIASFFLPDPLIAVDELVLTVGGAVLFFLGGRLRRLLNAYDAPEETRAQWSEDALLESAYRALRARETMEGGGSSVEAHSQWLIEHIDVPALVESGVTTAREVIDTLEVLGQFIPFQKIKALEGRTDRRSARRRRLTRTRLGFHYGLTTDAIMVYTELYKSATAGLAP